MKPESFLENVSRGTKAANPHLFSDFGADKAALCQIPEPKSERKVKAMNKTERHYHTFILSGKDARYEALTFRMRNGHRYTPDFSVFDDAGRLIECHECKGSYALYSQQRARLAFDQCKKEFTGIRWIWAVKTSDGWRVG
jgi:hypothetical protein